jgi:hypothetical protein
MVHGGYALLSADRQVRFIHPSMINIKSSFFANYPIPFKARNVTFEPGLPTVPLLALYSQRRRRGG